jgi:vitamin B12 transporter
LAINSYFNGKTQFGLYYKLVYICVEIDVMRLLLNLLLILLVTSVYAQTSIDGSIKDVKGVPVAGVSIYLKDTYDGATSDSSGKFSFKTFEKGEHLLIATSIGYKPQEFKLTIQDAPLNFDITLKEEINELKAVVITAGSFEASDRKKATVLNPIDIVTTASANGDVTEAIKTLPGAQQVGESEGLFVRGGTAGETKIFIDGSLVNNFFYTSVPNIAQRGRFSPFLFKGTVFSAGGYSALYGQALSSALILESIDLPERSTANLGVSFLNVSGGYQHLAKNKKSSWGIGYGYSNLDLAFRLIKQKQDYFKMIQSHEGDANFRIKTSNSGILKYYGSFSKNGLGFRVNSLDTLNYKDAFELGNLNMYHNLSWRENLNNGWKIILGASFTDNNDDISGSLQNQINEEVILQGLEFKNFDLKTKGLFFNAKAVIEKKLQGLSALRFGTEYNHSNDRADFTMFNGQEFPGTIKEDVNSVFAEVDIYVTNNLAAKVGSRMEHSSLLNKNNIAPRLSLAYKVGKESQASLAYGIFYQNPDRRYLSATSDLGFTKATHYIAQYQKVASKTTFRLEGFYKKYEDLIKTAFVNGRELADNNNGFGEAKGFELFWRDKKTIKNFDYWISYSYLDTKRDFLNYPTALQPGFAAKHTSSLVMKKFVTGLKTQFNASYNFASGRPYYNIRYDNNANKFSIFDEGKTRNYNSLSLSVNYLPNVFKQGANKFTVFVFSVTNVLNTRQEFGYQYSYNGVRKQAIVPPSRTFVFLGAFFSFGVDRSQESIDNTLSLRL